MFKYTLCGRSSSCCPVINEEEDNFTISDDYGGQIKLTKDEFLMLKEAVQQYQESSQGDSCGLN
jgi:hypothetical protein